MKRLNAQSLAVVVMALPLLLQGQEPAQPASPGVHQLGDYGPLQTPAQAQTTYEKAVRALRAEGGVLLVPATVWKNLKEVPLQGLVRAPRRRSRPHDGARGRASP